MVNSFQNQADFFQTILSLSYYVEINPHLEVFFCGDPGTSTYCFLFWQQEPLVTAAAVSFSINSSVAMKEPMLT